MFFHSRKTFLLPSVWPGTGYTWALIWKKSLLVCFESSQIIPCYSHTGRVDRNMNTLLLVKVNSTCKRVSRINNLCCSEATFPVNFENFLRRPFLHNTSRRLLLVVYSFLFYVRKKIDTWFVSPTKHFGTKPITFLSGNWQKNSFW